MVRPTSVGSGRRGSRSAFSWPAVCAAANRPASRRAMSGRSVAPAGRATPPLAQHPRTHSCGHQGCRAIRIGHPAHRPRRCLTTSSPARARRSRTDRKAGTARPPPPCVEQLLAVAEVVVQQRRRHPGLRGRCRATRVAAMPWRTKHARAASSATARWSGRPARRACGTPGQTGLRWGWGRRHAYIFNSND